MTGYDPGPGGWGPPPPGWGPPPGWSAYHQYPPQTDGKAIGALVAAILAWVACPVIPAVVALGLASQSQRDIAASQGRLTGDGFNTAARITAWINLALYLVVFVFVFFSWAAWR